MQLLAGLARALLGVVTEDRIVGHRHAPVFERRADVAEAALVGLEVARLVVGHTDLAVLDAQLTGAPHRVPAAVQLRMAHVEIASGRGGRAVVLAEIGMISTVAGIHPLLVGLISIVISNIYVIIRFPVYIDISAILREARHA